MSTFTWSPDPGASQNVQPKVRTATFGDGYQQRVGTGINTMPRSWSVSFTKSSAIIDSIEAFLSARAGVESFDWTPPTGVAGKWICRSWSRSLPEVDTHSLSASFEEVYGA